MIKNILQKSYIGLGIGLVVLATNQAHAQSSMPLSIQHLAFSNDSSQLLYISNASAAKSSVVNFIDMNSGQAVSSTQLALKERILDFTPDGFKTAVLEPKGLSILHNKTGKVLRTLQVPSLPWPKQYVASGAITNKSGTAQLFHSANKRILNVVHTGNGRLLAEVTLPAGTLQGMGISQDGRTVAYVMGAANTSQLYLFDSYQKKVTKTLDLPTLRGQTPNINTVAISPKAKYLVVQNSLVDLTSDTVTNLSRSDSSVPAIFTPNERFLLVAFGANQLVRYDLRSKQKQGISLGLPKHCQVSQTADISPNGKFVAYGSRCARINGGEAFISVLNAANGSFVKKLTLQP